jgi:diguanylate cyclase (GGDEF)-like protein
LSRLSPNLRFGFVYVLIIGLTASAYGPSWIWQTADAGVEWMLSTLGYPAPDLPFSESMLLAASKMSADFSTGWESFSHLVRAWSLQAVLLGASAVLLGLLVAFRSRRVPAHVQPTTDELTQAHESTVDHLNAALTNMAQGLCMFNSQHRLVLANRRFEEMYGLECGAIPPGAHLWDVWQACREVGSYSDEQLVRIESDLANQLRTLEPMTYVENLKDGRVISIARTPLRDGGWVTTFDDITERARAEAKVEYMALHDAVTGLPNRFSFRNELKRALTDIAPRTSIAVLCLDLDRFKSVNDTLGHPMGDLLLRQVAERLKNCLRSSGFVARLGGDEFAVIETSLATAEQAGILAAKIVDVLAEPFHLDGSRVLTGTSIGIALASAPSACPDQLVMAADLALYRAKADGRGTFRFFEPSMATHIQSRNALELDLRKAVKNGDLEVFYQPIVDLRTNRVSCFEALLRWEHPTRGAVSPSEFIPLAEEIGLISDIASLVLDRACHSATQWPSQIRVAVNLSAKQFRSMSLLSEVERALARSGLAASRLELEVTETILLQQTEQTMAILKQLRALGVRVSMDDFGTGYSSLSYLLAFPFDKIKIDKSFIKDLPQKSDAQAIVRAISGMGMNLGMITTAEGVETLDQLEWLRSEGCHEVQGYFISPAVKGSEVAKLLASLERPKGPVLLMAAATNEQNTSGARRRLLAG